VVGEAPGPDGATATTWQRPTDLEARDVGDMTRLEFHLRMVGPAKMGRPAERPAPVRVRSEDAPMATWDGEEYQRRFDRLAESGTPVHGEVDLVMTFGPVTVLDAGCGTGRVAVELARRGVQVVGVDPDPSMLATARAAAPALQWHEASMIGLDLGRRFDVVVMAGNVPLFTPTGTTPELVAGCARHLAAGGHLLAGFQLGRGYGIEATTGRPTPPGSSSSTGGRRGTAHRSTRQVTTPCRCTVRAARCSSRSRLRPRTTMWFAACATLSDLLCVPSSSGRTDEAVQGATNCFGDEVDSRRSTPSRRAPGASV
jgi:Methyltransferase domain